MFVEYQMLLYSDRKIVDSVTFKSYDDHSAMGKANKYFNAGQFDRVNLSKNGKNVKKFMKSNKK